jgi:hypothetical protein
MMVLDEAAKACHAVAWKGNRHLCWPLPATCNHFRAQPHAIAACRIRSQQGDSLTLMGDFQRGL